MKIRDLEAKTGLDRATIRYYEKEGLIVPTRQENGYRDYTEEDREELMKIKLLRQLGMPLDKIRNVQQGSGDFHKALEHQISFLIGVRDAAQRSIQICRMMQADGVTYENMKADYYIHQLRTASPQFPQAITSRITHYYSENIKRECYPWRRFFARGIDMALLAALLFFIQSVILRMGYDTITTGYFVNAILIMPIEALILMLFSTTPGKWAMGIRVDTCDGCKLDYRTALTRAWDVFRFGVGFGVPLWSTWRQYRSYKDCIEYGLTVWDDETELTYKPWDYKRIVATILVVIICAGMTISSVYFINVPKYQNKDINRKQFAEVFNDYFEILGGEDQVSLNPDGTFKEPEKSPNTVYVNGDQTVQPLEFILEGERVRGISYREDWENLFIVGCRPKRAWAAAAALLSTQPDQNMDTIAAMVDELKSKVNEALMNGTNAFEYVTGNVRITWKVEYENAEPSYALGLVALENEYGQARDDASATIWVTAEIIQ